LLEKRRGRRRRRQGVLADGKKRRSRRRGLAIGSSGGAVREMLYLSTSQVHLDVGVPL
jgi:hypothetical protein